MQKNESKLRLSELFLLYVTISVALLLLPLATAAQESDNPEYKKIIAEALKEFEIGNFEEACSLFRQAHRIYPNARTLRGLGMASFEARKYVDAIIALRAALDDIHKPLTDSQRAKVKELLKRSHGFVGYVKIDGKPSSVIVTVDGQNPLYEGDRLLLDPGERQIVVKAKGYRTLTRQLSVTGGSMNSIEIYLEPLDTTDARLPKLTDAGQQKPDAAPLKKNEDTDLVPWLMIGISGAVMVGGGVLLAVAANDISTVENAKQDTAWSEIKSANDRAPAISTAGFILLGAGAVGVATGIVLLTLDDSEENDSVSVLLRPNGIALRGTL